PICKAFMTDMGLETTSLGVQVFGGHGFIREWGMEQLMRDVRIAMLYEGTNGIQALDLIGRKLTRDGGQMMEATYNAFNALVSDIQDSEAKGLAQGILDDWRASSADCLGMDATTAAAAACDYLAYSAYSLIGVLWYSMADKAQASGNAVLAASKMKTRDFYMERILVRRDAHKAAYKVGPESTLAISGNEFDYL
ncbi:MAG: acyl-CoA dehydrogenase family protein, partial [Pseudomonadota bacterium]|nr:acyl-CoA dehydrogenase family protein [Pseudomonadota bacterium]